MTHNESSSTIKPEIIPTAPPPNPGMHHYHRITLDCGIGLIVLPAKMTIQDLDDFRQFLRIITDSIERKLEEEPA